MISMKIMVLHSGDDTSVTYKDTAIYASGQRIDIKIYGQNFVATPNFNYLGVHLLEFGSYAPYTEHRLDAYRIACNMLRASLYKLFAFSHNLLRYLWTALVTPVAAYA